MPADILCSPLALHRVNEFPYPTSPHSPTLDADRMLVLSPNLHSQCKCPPSCCSSRQVAVVLRPQSERQPIPDVPAVYFVRGGEAAVDAVAADAAKGLYDAMHLNFAPGLLPPLLERLAGKLVSAGAAHRVAKVPSALAFEAAARSCLHLQCRRTCSDTHHLRGNSDLLHCTLLHCIPSPARPCCPCATGV